MAENAKTAKTSYLLAGVIALSAVVLTFGYALGYRLKDDFTIGKIGALTLAVSVPETSVIIDQKEQIASSKENKNVEIYLSPGQHEIIVSRDLFFPWKKKVVMPSGGSITLSPILVSMNPSGQIINQDDPEFWKIKNSISKNISPTKEIPLLSADMSTLIWLEDNTVVAKIQNETQQIIKPEQNIRNIDFYKDRSDSIIFSADNGVYIIEISPKDNQNFMPIYKGSRPSFIKTDPNYIYIEDGDVLMQVVI